jgi:integrase
LTTGGIDRYYASLKGLYAPSTIHRLHQVLHRSLEVARKWGLIAVNPASQANPGPQPRRAITTPTTDDVISIIKAAGSPEIARFIRVAATTGMRPGELCGLQVHDLDMDSCRLQVRRRVVRGPRLEVIDMTKNGKSRTIALGPVTARILAEQVAATSGPYIFGGPNPWDPHVPSKRFAKAAQRAGIAIRLYDLRHGHVTALAGAGVDIGTISTRIGHARPSTTLNYYQGVVPGADSFAAAEADRLLG